MRDPILKELYRLEDKGIEKWSETDHERFQDIANYYSEEMKRINKIDYNKIYKG